MYKSVKKVSSVFSEEKCSQNFNAKRVDTCSSFMFTNKPNNLKFLKLVINCQTSNTEISRYQIVECCFDARSGKWEDSSCFHCFLFMISVIS